MKLLESVSLKPFNTFGIDARARLLAHIASVEDLQIILTDQKLQNHNRLILGGGSNVLFSGQVDALVLKIDLMGRAIIEEDDDSAVVEAGAGENWHELVRWTIAQNLGGLENLSLIPGNVGASPMQNIGAYGVEIKDTFHSLEAIELATGQVRTFLPEECAFGYRESVFKTSLKNQFAITKVRYDLSKKPTFNTRYGAIEQELERMGVDNLSLDAISQAVINIRQSKLPDPKELGNAGSFFKNPVIDEKQFRTLVKDFPNMPHYPAGGGNEKLAAGWLIEQCGWKGKRVGNCGMHERQALVLVNYGRATGDEIYAHSERVLQSVKEKFGVELEREVNVI